MNISEIYYEFCQKYPELIDSVVKYELGSESDRINIYMENDIGKTYGVIYIPGQPLITDLEVSEQLVDMVNHPPHYQSKNGLEAIDVIEGFTADLKGPEATNTGNVLKYMLRWKGKNGLEDLEKARWYLERLIKHVEKESKNHEKD